MIAEIQGQTKGHILAKRGKLLSKTEYDNESFNEYPTVTTEQLETDCSEALLTIRIPWNKAWLSIKINNYTMNYHNKISRPVYYS